MGSLMVLGIEGRSVVGNLRNVVSWSFRVTVLGILYASHWAAPSLAQEVPPANADPAAEAVELPAVPAEAVRKADTAVYAEPRVTEEEERKWRSANQIKLQTALKAIAPTNAETKVLTDAATMLVDKMTIPKFRADLHRNVVDPARRVVEGQLTQPKPRGIVLKAITDRSVELLAQNPPHHPDVQLNLVILLGTLNAKVAETNSAAVPYTVSAKALISVLEDPARPLQCRISAATGLGRMAKEAVVGVENGDLSAVKRAEIAASLAKVLIATDAQGNEDGKVWFRSRVAEALGDCGIAFDLNSESGLIDALLTAATNPAEHLRVRAASLRASTQLAWNGTINIPLVLHECLKLQLLIAQQYNAAILVNKAAVPANLNHANFEIYLCFRPKTAHQSNVLKWGLIHQTTRPGLAQHTPAITAAYAAALPVIQHIVANPKKPVSIPAPLIAALETWVKDNPPQNRKPTTLSPNDMP